MAQHLVGDSVPRGLKLLHFESLGDDPVLSTRVIIRWRLLTLTAVHIIVVILRGQRRGKGMGTLWQGATDGQRPGLEMNNRGEIPEPLEGPYVPRALGQHRPARCT